MILIAIDPGSSGGIAAWDGGMSWAVPYPTTEGDVLALLETIPAMVGATDRVAVIEQQQGVVGPGIRVSSASMFTFGRNYGFMLGVLQALKWKIHLVRPRKWQQALSLGSKKDHGGTTPWKNHLRAHAQRLYPDLKITLKTADALLILEYARRMRLNAPQMEQEVLV